MTCKNLCGKCRKITGHIDMDYIEHDPSGMATLQAMWLESPSTFFDRDCSLYPCSKHCKMIED